MARPSIYSKLVGRLKIARPARLLNISMLASLLNVLVVSLFGFAVLSDWDAEATQRPIVAQVRPAESSGPDLDRTEAARQVVAIANESEATNTAAGTPPSSAPAAAIADADKGVESKAQSKVEAPSAPAASEPATVKAPTPASAPASVVPTPPKADAPQEKSAPQEKIEPTKAAAAATPLPAAPAKLALSASPSEYRLAPGDKITVTVFGQTDLSGEYLIDDAGNITLPLAGVVAVASSTVKESEAMIAAGLADGFIRQPSVSVRISEHRPIFIVGDVKAPGSYPYRYGGTVLSAVASAGGYGVAEALPGAAAAEFMLVDERVRVLEMTRLALLVRQARLIAQLENEADFEVPYIPGLAPDSAQLTTIVAQERELMAAGRDALAKETDLQKSQRPRIQAEIQSLLKQTEGDKKQLELVNEQFNEYSKLDKLGLTRRATEITIQRERAALESGIAKLGADRARLDLMLGEIDIKIQDLELAEQRRLQGELKDVRQKLQEVETTLPVVHELRQLRAQLAGGITGIDGEAVTRSIFIMRTVNGTVTTIAATPDMMLDPGDIVEVKRTRPRGLPTASTGQPFGAAAAPAATSNFGVTVPPKAAVVENVVTTR